jgi:hypothetical protein
MGPAVCAAGIRRWEFFIKSRNRQKDFDLQMILGPVLRDVMAENMRAEENQQLVLISRLGDEVYANDEDNNRFIPYKTQIQTDGRYASLSPDEMYVFVAKPLGLNVAYVKDETIHYLAGNESGATETDGPLITMFHAGSNEGAAAGGHFELTLDRDELIDCELESDVHLGVVAEFFKYGELDISEIGIKFIKSYIKIIQNLESLSPEEITTRLAILHLTAESLASAYDIHFQTHAGEHLKNQVSTRLANKRSENAQSISSTADADNNSVDSTNVDSPLVNMVDIDGQDETIDDFSHDLDQGNRPPPENSSFWLRVMHCLAISGGVCAMVALLTCPPFAAALGLSTLCGVGINAISVTAGLLAGTSALFALGLFAATRTPQNPGNSLNNVRPT